MSIQHIGAAELSTEEIAQILGASLDSDEPEPDEIERALLYAERVGCVGEASINTASE